MTKVYYHEISSANPNWRGRSWKAECYLPQINKPYQYLTGYGSTAKEAVDLVLQCLHDRLANEALVRVIEA